MAIERRTLAWVLALVAAALLLPAIEYGIHRLPLWPWLMKWTYVAPLMPAIFAFMIVSLGLNIVTGFTGLLNLGAAAFVAIGAYTYSILTCEIYPFRLGWVLDEVIAGGRPSAHATWLTFVLGTMAAAGMGALVGAALSLPTMRLRGDYLAIVTLGFCEIVQDLLKNLDPITKGTTGINPVPHPPNLPALAAASEGSSAFIQHATGIYLYYRDATPHYLLYLLLMLGVAMLCRNLRRSRIGRSWVAVREDELAARSSGLDTARIKLSAFSWGAALCATGGALIAALVGTSIDPAYYDFQLSIIVLCAVIVGGMGSIGGVILGALVMFGFNGIVLVRLSDALAGSHTDGNVLTTPNNWKFLVYGLALVLVMRFKPEGLLPAREVRAEMRPPRQAPTVPP
ncbi:MAG: branched-chain amino acid ABC transporter permease [Planctomycetes bacterium]|nr:branched-chain amino acid ABC transporter permease [Planctomycetota bacterium]